MEENPFVRHYVEKKPEELGDIWKIYRAKDLTAVELTMFKAVVEAYHTLTGKKLSGHEGKVVS